MEKLSPEQRAAIKTGLKQQKENRGEAIEKKNRKCENRDEGKPKLPLSAYFLFAAAQSKDNSSKMSSFKTDWDRLSADRKMAYKQQAQQSRDAYE